MQRENKRRASSFATIGKVRHRKFKIVRRKMFSINVAGENDACSVGKDETCGVEKNMSVTRENDACSIGKDESGGVEKNMSDEETLMKEMMKNVRAMSIHSSYDSPESSEANISMKNNFEIENSHKMVDDLIWWSISLVGRSREMNDALTLTSDILDRKYKFFGVYDGHGGAKVAHACRDRLYNIVDEELKNNLEEKLRMNEVITDTEWRSNMESCFLKMDKVVMVNSDHDTFCACAICRDEAEEDVVEEEEVGSNALVVIVGAEDLVVTNCGNSRAVLYRSGTAIPLSNDHKVWF